MCCGVNPLKAPRRQHVSFFSLCGLWLGWGGLHGQVLRVYVGSFWDEPLMYDDNAALFDMEERDLMNDLRELPRNSAVRKINELVKRCRLAKVTVSIPVSHRFVFMLNLV